MVIEEKRNLLGIKGISKGEKLRQLTSYHMKLLKDGSLGYGVKGICDIHL
jgi:hypothetical protein